MLEVLLIMKSLHGEPKNLQETNTPAAQVVPSTTSADTWTVDRGTLDYFNLPE